MAGNIQLLAEAVVFLEAYGVDMRPALEVLGGGLAGSTVLDRKGDEHARRASSSPGFRLALHHKDMGIVTSAAREAGVAIPLGAVVAQLVAAMVARGDGGLDHSGLLKLVAGAVRPLSCHRRQRVTCCRLACRTARRVERATTKEPTMARMTAADAAVAILRAEGVTHAFGVPGAAINPFYAAMRRDGAIDHVLARHVEGASHMADGYTRTRAGNIGVCVGTSGPAGTDMITGLYAAAADSIPILVHHRPGARRAAAQGGLPGRRHRVDRRAGDQDGRHRAGGRAGARACSRRRSTSCARAGPGRC